MGEGEEEVDSEKKTTKRKNGNTTYLEIEVNDVEVVHVLDGFEQLFDVVNDFGFGQLRFGHEIREKLAAVQQLLHHQQPETRLSKHRKLPEEIIN